MAKNTATLKLAADELGIISDALASANTDALNEPQRRARLDLVQKLKEAEEALRASPLEK